MIARLRGILIAKQPPLIILDINGVGYEVYLPLNSFYDLPEIGKEIILHTHFVVREDAQSLFGFLTEKQRDLFRVLIRVNGIGPKSALTILSGMEPEVLVQCILQSDDRGLLRVPGIGKKTAQRLFIEARDSIAAFKDYVVRGGDNIASAVQDAVGALIALGYKPHEANRAIAQHKDKNMSSEELIKLALKEMNI
jgi:holliday junction DNA helicase RuvA